METTRQKVTQCKQKNPDWGYRKIANKLNVSPETVRYHLNSKYRKKSFERSAAHSKLNPIIDKVVFFNGRDVLRKRKKEFNRINKKRTKTAGNKFTTKELIKKIGDTPKCYLTGRTLDLSKPSEYNLDHIVPASKGGTNSLENCGISCSIANRSKTDMTLDEFLSLCKEILENHNFIVTKK